MRTTGNVSSQEFVDWLTLPYEVRRKEHRGPSLEKGVVSMSAIDEAGAVSATITVHSELLAKHTSYFDRFRAEAALGFRVRPGILKVFGQFVYTGLIFTAYDGNPTDHTCEMRYHATNEFAFLAEAWAFGDYILCTTFQDAVIDAIKSKLTEAPDEDPISLYQDVYDNSEPDSMIRKLVVDTAVHWTAWHINCHDHHADHLDFFCDLAEALLRLKNESQGGRLSPGPKDPCAYHSHVASEDEAPCYRTLF